MDLTHELYKRSEKDFLKLSKTYDDLREALVNEPTMDDENKLKELTELREDQRFVMSQYRIAFKQTHPELEAIRSRIDADIKRY